MRRGFSDDQLVLILVIIIALSIFSILSSLGKLGIFGMAGAASDTGYVNVTVSPTAEILVSTKSINFTGSEPGETKTSYAAADVETIEQGGNHIPCNDDNHCGINITNEGTGFINITIQESTTDPLFTSGTYSANTHFLYNVTVQDPNYGTTADPYAGKGNCSVGYDNGFQGVGGTGYWRGVPRSSSEVAVCYLNSSDTLGAATTESSDTRPDVARIEFNITIPGDEPAGDKGAAITFTAIYAEQ